MPRSSPLAVLCLALALALSLAIGACAGPSTPPVLAPAAVGDLAPVHAFGDLYLAGQPTAAELERARSLGVKTVVNLRKSSEQPDFDERAYVEKLGLTYVSLPWNGPAELSDEVFDEGRRLFATVRRPALVHCGSANRVGALWIPFRVLDQGVPLDDAIVEARTIGLSTPEYEAKALDYVDRRR